MSFRDLLRADAANLFAGADDFGEPVAYRPRAGDAHTFTAQVFRDPPADVPGGKGAAPSLRVFVPYSTDPLKGRTSIEVKADKISVAVKEGGTAEDLLVTGIDSQDPGGWTVVLGVGGR